MFVLLILLLAVIALLESVYIYRLIIRGAKVFNKEIEKSRIRYIIRAVSIVLGIAGVNMFEFPAVIILHIIFIAAVTQLINFILKKIYASRFETGFCLWKRIYALCIIPIIVTSGIMIYGYVNLHNIQRTQYTIYTEKDIRPEGYKIALIADVHYGVSLTGEEFKEQCEKISRENADIVILCGDIVDDNTTKEKMQECFQVLSSIKSEFGVFYVYGNHDRQRYSQNRQYSENDLVEAIESSDIKILCDDVINIGDDLVIAGREDASASSFSKEEKRKSIEALLSGTDKDKFILTLDHQPEEYAENAKAGSNLILSGHTHGGQLWPANILDNIFKFNELNYGEATVSGDTKAIVTSGFAGWNYPVKTSAPSEYVIVNVKKR